METSTLFWGDFSMHYTRFDTELIVRPDDIDMNNHVHNSKYLDYVLYARHDQMGRCYGMSMEQFATHGWTWYAKACHIEFKRPLNIGEHIIIRTWLESFEKSDVKVGFQILKKESMKVSAEGHFINTMISMSTGRAVTIPDWVLAQYTQFTG
jgi:acyl-CoA thioester hydrolase/thioesterase-3